MIEPPDGQVPHLHVGGVAIARLWHPNLVKRGGQLCGLALQCGPSGVVVAVPIKSLEHHSVVVLWPSLGQSFGANGEQQGC